MYQVSETRHELQPLWQEVFRAFAGDVDPTASWESVRPALGQKMQVVSGAALTEKVLAWLDATVGMEWYVKLTDETERETLLRGLVADGQLADFFMVLYQPVEGDLYWDDAAYLVYSKGEWRDVAATEQVVEATPALSGGVDAASDAAVQARAGVVMPSRRPGWACPTGMAPAS
jgi:hypothetical protein